MDFTGIALGSGVNQYMKMDEMARANKKLEMDQKLQQQQLDRGNVEMERMRTVDGLNKRYATINQAVARGEYEHPEVQGFVTNYNKNLGAFNNGYTMGMGQDAKGGRVLNFMDKDGNVVESHAMNPQNLNRMLRDAYMTELSYTSPEYFYKNYQLNQEDRKLGTDEQYKLNVIPGINAEDRASRERIAQAQLGPQYARLDFERNRAKFGNPTTMYDANGNPAIGIPVQQPDGSVTWKMSSAPEGYSFTHKSAGTKAPVNPEDVKEYRTAMANLGPRPTPQAGLLGGTKNQKAIETWDAQAAHIRQIYGVDAPASATPKVVARGEDPIAAARAQQKPRTQGLNLRQPPSVGYGQMMPPNIYDHSAD